MTYENHYAPEFGVSVTGGWLGTYRYGGAQSFLPPVRFEASIHAAPLNQANIYGEIVDDCALGAASMIGSQSGKIVRFSKNYLGVKAEKIGRAEYAGIVSDDGAVMRGTWRIQMNIGGVQVVPGTGTWEARRIWAEEEEPSSLTEQSAASSIGAATITAIGYAG